MSSSKNGITEITEGSTALYVPKLSLNTTVPPRTPAFFNPYAGLNRDLSMAAYQIYADRREDTVTMADVLAGTGARGVRVAAEVPNIDVIYINDRNPQAVELAKKAADANQVAGRCRFSVQDACRFLAEHSAPRSRFSIVDIDPFGSPAPYLDCALRAIEQGGLFSATATDTAALCGVYPKAAYRRYQGYPLKTEYCHEIGVRLLLGAVAHQAIRLELGIQPVFAHRTRHYFRIYTTVHTGAGWIDETYSQIGVIHHCPRCGHRSAGGPPLCRCPECGSALKQAGPLWIGEIHNREFLTAMTEDCKRHSFMEGWKIVSAALEETGMPPTYFTTDQVAAELGVASPSLNSVIRALREEGFISSRSGLNPKAFKTDAPAQNIRTIVKRLTNDH